MKKRAFSILELLVSIGIIAILLHIGSTVSFYAKRHARKLQCQSNVREIITAMTSYDTENYSFPWSFNNSEETMVFPEEGYAGTPVYDRTGYWWFDYLYEYHTRENTILWCTERDFEFSLDRFVLIGSYGVNQSVCKMYRAFPPKFRDFEGIPLSSEDVRQPSECLLVMDSGYAMINWWHAADVPPEPLELNSWRQHTAPYLPGLRSNAQRPIWPGLEKDALQGRHINGKINAAFVDGHVESTSPEDFAVTRQESGYKNVSHTWEPR